MSTLRTPVAGLPREFGPKYVHAAFLACFIALLVSAGASAQATRPEGKVSMFTIANSSFDQWTSNPTETQRRFMRDNYYRMLTYSPYFDSRLSWYPTAWDYEDAYAIYESSSVAVEHPEWVLKDTAGRNLYIPFGCSGGRCPQYAADIGNPEFQDFFIERERATMSAGYIGIYVDDVNLSRITVGDGNGDTVTPIDPRTGREMTLTAWTSYFADFMEKLSNAFPNHEIAHNVHWWSDRNDPSVVRQLDAAGWINFERGITDSGIRGGTGKYGFETLIALIDWLHERGKNVIMEDDDDDGLQERDYELAFFLLINNGEGDMVSSDGDRSRMNPDQFWSGYRTNLGNETTARHRWNDLFRREFECGIVLVNQPDMPTITVTLPGTFIDLEGRSVNEVTLVSSSGAVLRNSPCSAVVAPMPPDDLRVND
jgi:hypothetical protein